MKRFDRLIAILLQLQTSRLLRATDLAARYSVSERTIYRDMRSLETAGIPLVAEAGLGYYLDRSYQLPAVNFSPDEAIALLIGVKGVQAHVHGALSARAESAMEKLLAVMDTQQQDSLRELQSRISIEAPSRAVNSNEDSHYDTCQHALITRRTLQLAYTASYNRQSSARIIEPVGLCHYGGHWHLIAWCQLREAMRDFRLDRIDSVEILPTACGAKRERTLKSYFKSLEKKYTLSTVKIAFDTKLSHLVGMDKYRHGFIGSVQQGESEIMSFLTAHPQYLARWLLQFTSAVRVIDNPTMELTMQKLYRELQHYQ